MMQVSSLYACTLEKQFKPMSKKSVEHMSKSSDDIQITPGDSPPNYAANEEETLIYINEGSKSLSSSLIENLSLNNNEESPTKCIEPAPTQRRQSDSETKEMKEHSDRLCKLPSQCKSGFILGSPKRQGARSNTSRLSKSLSDIYVSTNHGYIRGHLKKNSVDKLGSKPSSESSSPNDSEPIPELKVGKKKKKGGKKEIKNLPSNFMNLGTWSTRHNGEKLFEQVRSGDVLEFNIKFHHHWGIALVNKNKKPTLESLELVHLKKDKDGHQKAVKQILGDYWTEGVTARINNSRDVHKQPLGAADVIATSLKVVAQPYKIWQNSEQLITYCRYGENTRPKQMSESSRFGSLSKCIGMWLNINNSSNHSSPASSPKIRRKRTLSVNF